MLKCRVSTAFLFLILICKAQINPPEINPIFREDTIPRIDIFISEDNLEKVLSEIDIDTEYPATFVYNNYSDDPDTLENVGFRIRGNVSRLDPKKSFKVSMNTFEPGRKYKGLEKINLKATGDLSYLKPKIAWYISREFGLVSTWVSHVELYINNDLWGLYTNVEHIDEVFIKDRFGTNNGNLYKCRYPASLEFLNLNPESYKFTGNYFENRIIRVYELKTNTEKDDYSDLADFIDKLNHLSDDDFANHINDYINVNKLLKFFAFEVYIGHWDSYSLPANNYYLYHNPLTGRFEYISYDMDLTFGVDFMLGNVSDHDPYDWRAEGMYRPLRERILQVDKYRRAYTFYLNQLTKQFPPDTLRVLGETIQNFIAPYVERDPFFPFSIEEFFGSLDQPLNFGQWGIIEFIEERRNSLLTQLEDTQTDPIFSEISFSDHLINDTIRIGCSVEDESTDLDIKVYYSLNSGEQLISDFSRTYSNADKGLSKWQLDLDPMTTSGYLNFYIEATDNDLNVSREPIAGTYQIKINDTISYLLINECLASNSRSMTDEFGERDDWIELYNSGTSIENLENKYLTDSYTNPNEWQLPDTSLNPGEYIWFWADNSPDQGKHHTNFKLAKGGETIYLFEKIDNSYFLLDSMNYPEQESDVSYGRSVAENPEHDFLDLLTPGYSNDTRDLAYAIFRVNMKKQIAEGSFNAASGLLDVIGNFNNWNGSLPFYDLNEDSIYMQTIYGIPANTEIAYRFRLGSEAGKSEFPDLPGTDGDRTYVLSEGCNNITHWFNDEEFTPENIISNYSYLKVYPNPAVNSIALESEEFIKRVSLTDLQGQLVLQQKTSGETTNYELKVGQLPAGIYLLSIEYTSGEIELCKIVKQ